MANLPTSLNWLEDFGGRALAVPALNNAEVTPIVEPRSFVTKTRRVVSCSQFSCNFETKSGPCTKAFPRSCDLKKHQKNHTRPIACKYFPGCKLRFPTLKDRDRHISTGHKVHDGSLRYCCTAAKCWSSIEYALDIWPDLPELFCFVFPRKDAWQSHMTTHKLSRGQIREIRTKGIPTLIWKQGKWERGHLDTVQRTSKRQDEAADATNSAPARITGRFNARKYTKLSPPRTIPPPVSFPTQQVHKSTPAPSSDTLSMSPSP